jgi:hypothetical protein
MSQAAPNKTLVLWVIWLAFLVALFKFQFIIGGGLPSGEDDGMASVMKSWQTKPFFLVSSC